MPANMKCGRLRASNCFEVFFSPPPSPRSAATAASAPSFSLLVLLSTAIPPSLPPSPPVYQQVCALPLPFSPSSLHFVLLYRANRRDREKRFPASVFFTQRSSLPPSLPCLSWFPPSCFFSFFFLHGLFALKRVDRSILEKASR